MTTELVQASVLLVVLISVLGSAELGYRLGRRNRGIDEAAASQVGTWEGALLGLLALLIGFTFAMAVTRFDGRRELILKEADSIQQVARRAETIDAPMGQQVTGILRNYVEARLRFYDAGLSMARTEAAALEATALQRQLWSYVVEVARAHPDSEMAALFVEAADELVDAGNARRAALDNHVPVPVFVVLLLVAAAATGASGYSCGLRRRRHKFGMIMLPVLITAVVLLVLDLDHPRAGLIKAGQGPMLRLQESLSPAPVPQVL
jgi:hypothetical protein